MICGIDQASLIIAPNANTGAGQFNLLKHFSGDRIDILTVEITAKQQASHTQVQNQGGLLQEVAVDDGGKIIGVRLQPVHDGLSLRHRHQTAGLPQGIPGQARMNFGQFMQQIPGRFLRYSQVLVIGIVTGLACGMTDTHA